MWGYGTRKFQTRRWFGLLIETPHLQTPQVFSRSPTKALFLLMEQTKSYGQQIKQSLRLAIQSCSC
uniref:Serine/threonine-protein kinase n=1 Tax=Rhizophora mucronata TaxID=61149 RepID=A0A2P2PPA7_RHIMU